MHHLKVICNIIFLCILLLENIEIILVVECQEIIHKAVRRLNYFKKISSDKYFSVSRGKKSSQQTITGWGTVSVVKFWEFSISVFLSVRPVLHENPPEEKLLLRQNITKRVREMTGGCWNLMEGLRQIDRVALSSTVTLWPARKVPRRCLCLDQDISTYPACRSSHISASS